MKCQVCQQAEAVVHVKQAVNGQAREMHLCRACAARNGLDVQAPMGIADFLFGLEVQQPPAQPQPAEACKACGMQRTEFRKNSRLGCAACYDVFAEDLAPMLADMQKGPAHVGKMPSRVKLGTELGELENELKRAVETENYERAAGIRDRIHTLRSHSEGRER